MTHPVLGKPRGERHHDHLLQKQPKSACKAKAVRNSHQPLMVAG